MAEKHTHEFAISQVGQLLPLPHSPTRNPLGKLLGTLLPATKDEVLRENLLLITRLLSCEYQTRRLTESVAVEWRQIKNVWVWTVQQGKAGLYSSILFPLLWKLMTDLSVTQKAFFLFMLQKEICWLCVFLCETTRLHRDPGPDSGLCCCYSSCCFLQQKLAILLWSFLQKIPPYSVKDRHRALNSKPFPARSCVFCECWGVF